MPALGLCLLAGSPSAFAQVTGAGDINPSVPAPPLPTWSLGSTDLVIGVTGAGTLTIEQGGRVEAASMFVGSGGAGTLNLLGDAASGRGVLEVNAIAINPTGTFNLNGGILRARINTSSFFDSVGVQTIGANGAFFDSNGNNIGISASFDGTGGLTKLGAGTLTLSGTNSYSGGTTISGGKLSVSSDANLGAASGGLTLDGGVLLVTGSFSSSRSVTLGSASGGIEVAGGQYFTHNGTISGSGDLTKSGAGTLILAGTSTYSGATTVSAGTLLISRSTAMSAASDYTIAAGALLDVNDALGTVTAGSIAGAGQIRIESDSTLETGSTNASTTVSGMIYDAGSLRKVGSGTLTLTEENTYSGGTTIAGGAISISKESNLGSTPGALTLDGGVLQVTGTTLHELTRNIVLGSAGGGFDIADAGNTFTVTQSLSGTGSLTKAGAGTLVLTGTNSYTGDTVVQAGRLVGDNASSFSSDSNVTVSAGATLAVSGGIFATVGSLSGAGGVEIASGSVLIMGSTDQSRTFAGGFSGDGALGFTGAGTQIYTGTGTLGGGFTSCVCATGQFVVRGGSLTFGDDVRVQGGTLLVDQGGHLDNGSGTLLVASKLTVDGAGSAVSTGITLVQSFAGTTSLTVSGGASLIGSGGASLIGFGGSAEALVTGSGSQWVVGGGGLSIAPGATTATSVTVAEGGELRIASGDLQIAALGRLNIGNGGRAGSINVVSGAIVNDGAIVANFTDSYSYSGAIDGSGSLTKMGAGTLTLSGMNGYSGATLVSGGKLVVNGSITSSSGVTVAAGATIGGSGTLPSLMVNGTLAPGNSPGTMTVKGNLTLAAGSTYEAEVQGAVSDRVNVTGTAALAGTLKIIPLGGAYSFNNPYTLLSAAGGRTGTFNPVTAAGSFGAGVATTVSYTATDVQLTLTPNPLTPIVATPRLGVAAPANAYAVATAIDGAVAAGGNPSALFGIYNLPAASIPAAVNQLSGEIHTAAPAMANLASDQFLRAMLDPMAAGRLGLGAPGPGGAAFSGLLRKGGDQPAASAQLDRPVYSVWGSAFGSHGRTDGEAAVGSARRTLDDTHLATGVDIRLAPGTIAGLAVSGGKAWAALPGMLGKIDADVFQAGLYGIAQLGPVRFGAAGSYARLDNDVSRSIPVLGSSLSSSYATTAWSGRLQASFAAMSWNGLSLSPLAALQATRARSPAVIEANWAGANAGALALGKRGETSSRGELGLQLDADGRFGGVSVTGYIRAAWAHYFQRSGELTASLTSLPGAAFKVAGAKADRNSALVAAGISARLSEGVTLGLNLDGELATNNNRIGASAQFRVSF
uniref:Autotransporter domain-containing protein n=1 Tax=Bosea sp. NBC_00436 TaxID=2969620 RepID=A0A9E8A7L7_9HYPH